MMQLNPKNMNYINKFIYTILLFNFFICFSQDNESEKTQDRLVEWAKKILEQAE